MWKLQNNFKFLFSLLLIIQLIQCNLSETNVQTINDQHKIRLKSLFNLDQQVDTDTLPNIYYSIVGLNVLHNHNLNVAFVSTQNKNEFCEKLKSFISQEKNQNLDNFFYVSSSLKMLSCQFDTVQLTSRMEPMLSPTQSPITVMNLFKVACCLENANSRLPSVKVAKLLNDALVNDHSLLSAGLSLQLAAKLAKNEQTQFLNKIPNLLTRADEVDSKYLQFDGGLTVTASIVRGILELSTTANKTTILSDVQITKFVNYFLNRLTVQTTKGAAELLHILKLFSNHKHYVPAIVSLYGSNVVNEQNTNIVVKVTNTLGQTLGRELRVAAKLNDLPEMLRFETVSGDSTMFALDLQAQIKKLPPSKYNLKVFVEPMKVDKALVIDKKPYEFDIVIQASRTQLDSIEIGLADKDQLVFKYDPIEYPESLKDTLLADNSQKLSIKFCVRDLLQSKDLTVQQALIYLVNERTNKETIFTTDQDRISKVYNKDINLAYKGKDFDYQSGDYVIKLVVGDTLLFKPVSWTLGKVNIAFNNQDPIEEVSHSQRYVKKPQIIHQFRKAEPRPPAIVSQSFTLLVLSPILIMLICWSQISINFSYFTFSLSAILFHGSLLLIFTLYTLFFIGMNMFQTLKCLSGVLIIAFISGHFLLKSIASKSS